MQCERTRVLSLAAFLFIVAELCNCGVFFTYSCKMTELWCYIETDEALEVISSVCTKQTKLRLILKEPLELTPHLQCCPKWDLPTCAESPGRESWHFLSVINCCVTREDR